jgi:hypothetical protein
VLDLRCFAEETRNCRGKVFDDDAEVFSSFFSATRLDEVLGMAVAPGWLDSKCFEINCKTYGRTLTRHCSPQSFPLLGSPTKLVLQTAKPVKFLKSR